MAKPIIQNKEMAKFETKSSYIYIYIYNYKKNKKIKKKEES